MSIFEDKTYDQLDWMSKTIEPLVFKGNETLAQLPDRFEIGPEKIFKIVVDNYWTTCVSTEDMFKEMLKSCGVEKMSEQLLDVLKSAYEIGCDELVDLDPENGTGPTIYIKKTKDSILDKEIIEYVISSARSILMGWPSSISNGDIGRLNEVCDVLDVEPRVRSNRSSKKKSVSIMEQYINIVKKDTWQVKDVDLLIKIATWIRSYVLDGNLAALSNITKLKVMTHKNKPIYSMKETV